MHSPNTSVPSFVPSSRSFCLTRKFRCRIRTYHVNVTVRQSTGPHIDSPSTSLSYLFPPFHSPYSPLSLPPLFYPPLFMAVRKLSGDKKGEKPRVTLWLGLPEDARKRCGGEVASAGDDVVAPGVDEEGIILMLVCPLEMTSLLLSSPSNLPLDFPDQQSRFPGVPRASLM